VYRGAQIAIAILAAQGTSIPLPRPNDAARAVLRSVADRDLPAVTRAIFDAVGRTQQVVSVESTSDVKTCAAFGLGPRGVITCNPDFLARSRQLAQTDWAIVFILAHEVAHHLKGDTVPKSSPIDYRYVEIDANEIAGLVLARLGAPLDESLRAVKAACKLADSALASPELCENPVESGWWRAVLWIRARR
jgi:hypothetical protein